MRSDNNPAWHSTTCQTNWNEVSQTSPAGAMPVLFNHLADIGGIKAIHQAADIDGKTIADQLAREGRDWRIYQKARRWPVPITWGPATARLRT